ncbi:hypothetical protein FSARC_2923 [Fusarium sarcochroum]|uniref:Uncharacterized protein n=1 Tax=Fusarium sarcochroum TaxID=1208366 RepID=A0A8H4U555_9HYPO|nr:hypothetical protein FSARC_2923 [Fusarium sarcochroum]
MNLSCLDEGETLEITDGSFATVLDELDKQEADVARAKQLYQALDALRPELSKKDVSRLNGRSFFKENKRIVLSENDPTWHRSAECVWAPKLKSPDLTNPSELYPELESFFAELLGIPKIDIGVVYNDLINFSTRIMLDPSDPPKEQAKRLLVALSEEINEYGHLLDKEKLLQCEVFPIVGTEGKVRLCSSSTIFLIADREYLYDGFWRKMDLLDVTPTTAWLMGPFFAWAGLEDRYLSKNVEMTGKWYGKAMNKEATPCIHPSRAVGLLRIAAHFRSPRTATIADRRVLARRLNKTRIYYLGKDARTATLSMKRTGIASVEADNPLSGVAIRDDDDDELHIYIDSKLTEVASAVLLPRQLTGWLMRDPETRVIKSLDERIVGLVRTIIRVNHQNLGSIRRILDAEGIVNVDELNKSPYIQQKKKEEKPVRVFGAEPTPPTTDSQKSTPLPAEPQAKAAGSTSPQVNDLTQKIWTLNLQPKIDTSKTTENPEWIKFF